MKTGTRSGRSSATSSLTARPMPIQTISPLIVLRLCGPLARVGRRSSPSTVTGCLAPRPSVQTDLAVASHVATASFMVSPASRGRRVGRRLGEYALQWAADAGFKAMQFNAVVDTNTAAVALWESLGFETIGIVPEAFDSRSHGLVGLRVMYRRLP